MIQMNQQQMDRRTLRSFRRGQSVDQWVNQRSIDTTQQANGPWIIGRSRNGCDAVNAFRRLIGLARQRGCDGVLNERIMVRRQL